MTLKSTLFDNQQIQYHYIVVRNEYLNKNGLNTLTIDQFIEWWNKRDLENNFVNRKFFDNSGAKIESLQKFLNLDNSNPKPNNFYFKTWRKKGYGAEEKYYGNKINSWEYYEEPLNSNKNLIYSFNDLSFNAITVPQGIDLPEWFYRIIASHNSVIKAFSDYPNQSDWPVSLKARKALSRDIIISEGLYWYANLKFSENEQPQEAWFALKLREGKDLKQANNTVGFKDIIISSVAKDALDRPIYQTRKGDWLKAGNINDPREFKNGSLSLVWNETTKGFESGTLQIVAVLTTDIEAANQRTSDVLENMNIKEMLENPFSDTYLDMPTGIAIPLLGVEDIPVLAPTYKKEQSSRGESLEKQKVIVYNPFPRSFLKDQVIVLSRINGYWMPIDSGEGDEKAAAKKKKVKYPEKWSFAYFMTNPNFFYVKEDGTRFRYQDHELSERSKYYRRGKLFSEVFLPDQDNVSTDQQFNMPTGYLQITSFDFVNDRLGGVNTTTSLGNTHIEFDASTSPYEKGGSDIRIAAINTAPFFGCVFPDGYDDDKIEKYKNGNFDGANIVDEPEGSNEYIYDIPSANCFDITNHTNKITPMFPVNQNGVFKDVSLSHLPADIALSASSFSGIYGMPISILDQNSSLGEAASDDEEFPAISHAYNLMLGHTLKINGEKDDPYRSFYDFKPVNKNRIQFRPLKAEIFAFITDDKSSKESEEYLALANAAYVRANRGIFGVEARNTQKHFEDIFSTKVITRTQFNKKNEYNADFLITQGGDSSKPPTINPFYNNNTNADNFSPFIWGYKDWLLHPERGGGGIGVIGAQYTVSAESSIIFDTKSLLGQPAVKKMRQYNFNDSLVVLNLGGAGMGWGGGSYNPIVTDIDQMWGRCDSYYDLNTTALFVRIFAAWPREQTIYDPRFFSVFHFNPHPPFDIVNGTGIALAEPNAHWHKNGIKQDLDPNEEPPSGEEKSYPNGWYIVYEVLTTVDVKVPTQTDGWAWDYDYLEQKNLDGIKFTGGELRQVKDWDINANRRGKLLPFRTYITTTGIGQIKNFRSASQTVEFKSIIIDPQNTNDIKDKHFDEYDCIIYNKGQGYKSGDLFTVTDGINAILEAQVDATGGITGFKVINQGAFMSTNFLPKKNESFLKEDGTTVKTSSDVNLLKIVPLQLTGGQSTGKNFLGFVSRIWLAPLLIEDNGPAEVTSAVKLTPNPNGELDLTYEPSRITDISVLKTLEDGTVEPYSENDQYDLFFHFHNDISHTLIGRDINLLGAAGKWGGNNAWENAVTLTLSSK